jgi:hypothetical protein
MSPPDQSYDSGISSPEGSVCEWDFLDEQAMFTNEIIDSFSGPTPHECKNAPLVMQSALSELEQSASDSQYGLFGQIVSMQ